MAVDELQIERADPFLSGSALGLGRDPERHDGPVVPAFFHALLVQDHVFGSLDQPSQLVTAAGRRILPHGNGRSGVTIPNELEVLLDHAVRIGHSHRCRWRCPDRRRRRWYFSLCFCDEFLSFFLEFLKFSFPFFLGFIQGSCELVLEILFKFLSLFGKLLVFLGLELPLKILAYAFNLGLKFSLSYILCRFLLPLKGGRYRMFAIVSSGALSSLIDS